MSDDIFFQKEYSEEELFYNIEEEERSEHKVLETEKQDFQLNIKGPHKNKIINKLKEILPENEIQSFSKINSVTEKMQQNSSVQSLDKKQRNKRSAQQSRNRKKLYIQILQQKHKNLSKQLQNKKNELVETKFYLERVVNQNKTMSGFTASRHQMMKKLQILLQKAEKGEDPSSEINPIIDSLRYRIGATGKQRINTINEYFRQIVNLSLPALHRYMMWSAAEGKHLFSSAQGVEQNDQWFYELKNTLNLTEQQKQQILSKRQFLKEQKNLLQKLVLDLKNIKSEIEVKSVELEDTIDGIRQILSPKQSANFILFIEKNKYRKQLNLCENFIEESQPSLRKIIKREN